MWFRSMTDTRPRSHRNGLRRSSRRLLIEPLEGRIVLTAYFQTNLAADQPGVAQIHDAELVDAWGIAINPNGTFWLSARATDVSTVYSGDVTKADGTRTPFVKSALTVSIPEGAPTGQVFNGSSEFVVSEGGFSAPARFIFASDAGHITGWSPAVPPPAPSRHAQLMASTPGAVYTGLAIGNNGSGNFLYAADFHGDKIDVFDGTYTPTTLAGSFVDPEIPEDYAPYNIQNLGGQLYVTYARPQEVGDAIVRGGSGYVSVFDANGNFLNRLISEDRLQSPWGVALAPADFGEFSGSLIVGNYGNGHINAFDAATGAFLGRLRDASGEPIHIEGVFGLAFGNGTVSGDRNALYFAAASEDHAHGLFGSLRIVPEPAAAEADDGALLALALVTTEFADNETGDNLPNELEEVPPMGTSEELADLAIASGPEAIIAAVGELVDEDHEGLTELDELFALNLDLNGEIGETLLF